MKNEPLGEEQFPFQDKGFVLDKVDALNFMFGEVMEGRSDGGKVMIVRWTGKNDEVRAIAMTEDVAKEFVRKIRQWRRSLREDPQ